jgi:CheY-like chemotaxis protein
MKMIARIELLEFIQCVLAQVLKQHHKDIHPCLINKTGFYNVVYKADPKLMYQQLNDLVELALLQAEQQLLLVVSSNHKHLELSIFADNQPQAAAMCTTPEKAFFSQQLVLPTQPLGLIANSDRLQRIMPSLIAHSTMPLTSSIDELSIPVLLCDSSETEQEQEPEEHSLKITFCDLTIDDILQDNQLFWPFYDTDIISMLSGTRDTKQLSILIADDSIPSQVATQAMLEKLGCKVQSANDGNTALAMAQQQAFDLILLDERMPGLYGSDVAQCLVTEGAMNKLTPKVALTGLTESEDIQALFDKGISHYLEKPVTKLALEKFLTHWQRR